MTTDAQFERHTDYITGVFDRELTSGEPDMTHLPLDQQPEVETAREPVNTETHIDTRTDAEVHESINARLDRIEANDGKALASSYDLPWHFSAERGCIYDSEGVYVMQAKQPYDPALYLRICADHNVANLANAFVWESIAQNTRPAEGGRERQLFDAIEAAL